MAVLFSARAVQAEPVRIHQVVQTVSSYQGPADLRLGNITTQDPSGNSRPSNGKTEQDNDGRFDGAIIAPDGSVLPLLQDPQKLGVEIVEEAEVEGTICDCGYFDIPGGGFPKWPLLFLAAVPLIFINECDDCDENPQSTPTPTPPPPPTPTPTPTPEPASLLLFGTGLLAAGAGLDASSGLVSQGDWPRSTRGLRTGSATTRRAVTTKGTRSTKYGLIGFVPFVPLRALM
jgi:hypothetical protein